jgi:hypothetical protein
VEATLILSLKQAFSLSSRWEHKSGEAIRTGRSHGNTRYVRVRMTLLFLSGRSPLPWASLVGSFRYQSDESHHPWRCSYPFSLCLSSGSITFPGLSHVAFFFLISTLSSISCVPKRGRVQMSCQHFLNSLVLQAPRH